MTQDAFQKHWQMLTQQDHGATLAPALDQTLITSGHEPLAERVAGDAHVEALRVLELNDTDGELHMLGSLGAGGMAEVFLAEQRALRREVALKCLHAEHLQDARLVQGLIREGLLTGGLEHPNIVPVHDLGVNAEGSPILVMKQVKGRTLQDMLESADAAEHQVEHIRSLMQVCHAIHFAHTHGVLHRDLKPENIMVGAFGEVYVMDWGIAVPMSNGRYVLPVEAGLCGTPHYLAPEMAGRGDTLDARTDVYQLGGVLHTIVTGRPLHEGDGLMEVMQSAYLSKPRDYDDAVPDELQQILHRALATAPEARFPSADALRHALANFLEHRAAFALSRRARSHMERLRVLAAPLLEAAQPEAPQPTSSASATPEQVARLDADFNACHIAFTQALEVWPEHPSARAELDDALELMARVELELEQGRTARRHISEMATRAPAPELLEGIERLEQRRKARNAELEHLKRRERELNPVIDASARGKLLSFGSALTLMLNVCAIGVLDPETSAPVSMGGATFVFLVGVLVFVAVFRRVLLGNVIGRRLISMLLMLALIGLGTALLAAYRGLDDVTTHIEFFGALAVSLWPVAIFVDRALGLGAIVLTLVTALLAVRPEWTQMMYLGAVPLAMLSVGLVWWFKPRALWSNLRLPDEPEQPPRLTPSR